MNRKDVERLVSFYGNDALSNGVSVELAFYALLSDMDKVREASNRQADNMAFILNHAELPKQWYDKFTKELAEDRQALAATERWKK